MLRKKIMNILYLIMVHKSGMVKLWKQKNANYLGSGYCLPID
jgi:hypothetical protein